MQARAGAHGREVDPEIARIVGDVSRPRAPIRYSRELAHLPGESGWRAGARTLLGMAFEGEPYFGSLARRYGPVFRHMVGPNPIVALADADLVWRVMRNDDGAFSAALAWTDFLLGLAPGDTVDGPLALDFETHRDARRLLQPAFGAPAIASYVSAAQGLYERTIDDWLRRGRIRFKPEVRRVFAAVSARIFMGIDDPSEAAMLDAAIADGWRAILAVWKRSPFSPAWRRARRGVDTLWRTLRPRMKDAGGDDLFSRLCRTKDEAAWLDDDARLRMFITLMFAAFDTTAAGVTSMGYLLGRHRSWQEKLRDEASALGAAPAADALRSLEQHDRVWKETLRLYPVAGPASRVALREVELGEWRVPAGALVFSLLGTLANEPRWWTEPSRFDPDRFSPERAEDKRHKAIFLPFGAGVHTCIGAQLAAMEVKAFWQMLLRRARLTLVRDRPERHAYRPIGMMRGDIEVVLSPA